MNKIFNLDALAEKIAELKAGGRRIVLAHGVFDLLHIGHIRYLRQARQFGDLLVVTLTPDRFVDKGPGRPVFNEAVRAEMLASLGFVDFVAVNQWPTAENTLRRLRPDVYAKGADFKSIESDPTGKLALEARAVEEIGAEFRFTEDVVFSSSHLINQHLDIYPEELAEYLALVRQRHQLDEVLAWLEKMRGLRVLVLGDAIIDEYVYCSPLGLSSKDPTLAVRRISDEWFPGGALAVARHAAGLADRVTVLTLFGEKGGPGREAIAKRLPPGLELIYETIPGAPTVRKLRYLDNSSLAKFLEVYDLEVEPPPPVTEQALVERLSAIIKDYDLVLAADFGHGAISETAIRILCRDARFLAVNTQANAGNRGFHTIFRYPRADFISLATHELTLAFQDRRSPTYDLMLKLFRRLSPEVLIVTSGADGLKALDHNDFIQTPAVAVRAVDRVGAGDALFTACALAACLGCPLELIGLIGNIAGAHLVESVGNNAALEAAKIQKALTAMLK